MGQKILDIPQSISGRLQIWQGTLGILQEHIWLGCGIGNFRLAFIQYSPQEIYEHFGPLLYAHNDYLQFLLEYGILGSVFMVLFWIVWIYHVKKIEKQGVYSRILLSGIHASIFMMLLHGIWDYSWHIPSHFFLMSICMASLVTKDVHTTGNTPIC